MTIYIGADHRGFNLKEQLKALLIKDSYEVVDLSAPELVPGDDYPAYAAKVTHEVNQKPGENWGILLCGSGFGMDIAANKVRGIRAALPMSPDHAYQARHDDNANVLVIAADFTDVADALKITKTFLSTPFASDERYQRRLDDVSKLSDQ
jgi:ribose 5-phosphate isomerase B